MSHQFIACCDECRRRSCADCIQGAVIDASAGCCHGIPERRLGIYRRNTYSHSFHSFGHPGSGGDPPECPGGCEVAGTYTFLAMDDVKVLWNSEASYFKCDYEAKDNDRTDRHPCGIGCADATTDCCTLDESFIAFSGCVCAPEAFLSAFQKDVMEDEPAFQWIIDIACHAGADCFPPIRALNNCTEIPGDTDLFANLLCVVHREFWYRISDCEHAVDPPIHAPNDPDTPISIQCFGPKRWVAACSGCPLFFFELYDAVDQGVLTSEEMCDALADANLGFSLPQTTLQKLYDAGYIKVKDWRPEILVELQELKDRTGIVADAYAECELPESCADLPVVGAVRKTFWPCLKASEVAETAIPLNPEYPGGCNIDPWGGAYPDPEDDDYDDYVFWARRQHVYFHPRPGGDDYICFSPGLDDSFIPDLPRHFDTECSSSDCFDIDLPQDFTCEDGPYDGVEPGTGLATCTISACDAYGSPGSENEFGCIFLDVACGTAGDGSTCLNMAVTSNCGGLHAVVTQVAVRKITPDVAHPTGIEFYCLRRTDFDLVYLNRDCDWSATPCYQCAPVSRIVVIDDVPPIVAPAYLNHRGICIQIFLGSGDAPCCGGFCYDLGDPCAIAELGPDCESICNGDGSCGEVGPDQGDCI